MINLKKKVEEASVTDNSEDVVKVASEFPEFDNSVQYEQLYQVNPKLAELLFIIDRKLLDISIERNVKQGYKSSYAVVGLQGIIFQVLHKTERIKNTVTDGTDFTMNEAQMMNTAINEYANLDIKGIYEHLIDLINYCKLALAHMHDKSQYYIE